MRLRSLSLALASAGLATSNVEDEPRIKNIAIIGMLVLGMKCSILN